MKHFIYVILAFTVTFASCDILKEEEKPKPAQSTTENGERGRGAEKPKIPKQNKIGGKRGVRTKKPQLSAGTTLQSNKATIAIPVPRRAKIYPPGTITKKTTVAEDRGVITYASSDDTIATVDDKGEVTFVKAEGGTVTITATKAGTPKKYKSSTATYTLVIDHPDGSTIAFASKTVSQEFKAPFTFTQAVTKPRNVDDDTGAITYTSSDPLIATVDEKGLLFLIDKSRGIAGRVTLKKPGEVTITATKAATPENKYKQSEDSYTLTITRFKPATKQELVDEIKIAMKVLGNNADLNYIDTSAITDMSYLFAKHALGYGLHTFNGNISTWDTSNVETMARMFQGNTAFDKDISGWNVNSVTNMDGMFNGATAFNRNLNAWTPYLKFRDISQETMFQNSGIATSNSYPTWCVSRCKKTK